MKFQGVEISLPSTTRAWAKGFPGARGLNFYAAIITYQGERGYVIRDVKKGLSRRQQKKAIKRTLIKTQHYIDHVLYARGGK